MGLAAVPWDVVRMLVMFIVRMQMLVFHRLVRVLVLMVLGGFAALTVFSDPRIEVRRVGARPRAGGYTFTAAARLRS